MGVKINQETRDFEPWEPDYLLLPNRHVSRSKTIRSYWPEIPPLSYFFDSLNWKLFALSITAYFSLCLFVTPAYAELSGRALDALTIKIIAAESSGNPLAVGPAGERGLMQIEKATWMEYSDFSWNEAFDPDKNVQVGRAILENINSVYAERASAGRIVYTYNTGIFCFRKHLPRWTNHHPNKIYRAIFKGGSK